MLYHKQYLIHQENKRQEQQKGIQSGLVAFSHQEKYVSSGWWMGHALAPEGVSGKAGKCHLKGMNWLKIISWPREALNAALTSMITE